MLRERRPGPGRGSVRRDRTTAQRAASAPGRPERLAPERLAPERLAPERLAPEQPVSDQENGARRVARERLAPVAGPDRRLAWTKVPDGRPRKSARRAQPAPSVGHPSYATLRQSTEASAQVA